MNYKQDCATRSPSKSSDDSSHPFSCSYRYIPSDNSYLVVCIREELNGNKILAMQTCLSSSVKQILYKCQSNCEQADQEVIFLCRVLHTPIIHSTNISGL